MKITDRCATQGNEMVYISDFTPLKSASADDSVKHVQDLAVDFICVAYNPGKAARVASAMLAYTLKQRTERDVIFNLSPRDMNKLALQSHLLGAQMLGLDNVLVVQGDNFTPRDLEKVKDVSDYKSTELMQSIAAMNEGKDFKDLKLKSPTDLCIGATIDLGRGLEKEARLTHRKVQSGAHYFLTQPVFSIKEVTDFRESYQTVADAALTQPIFWGLQLFIPGGIIFSSVPESIRQDLAKGRDGIELALEVLEQLQNFGINRIYLIPPIIKGGGRDYDVVKEMLAQARQI